MSLKSRIANNRGMTLLELLLVVTILSAVAWMSLGVVGNRSDQLHFDDTRQRINAIRHAIVGDTSRKLNGHSEISGYIADMGQVPPSLNALLRQNYCAGAPEVLTDEIDCVSAGGTWVTQPDYDCKNASGDCNGWLVQAGWNGPYLTAAEHNDYPRFQDGWGNNDSGDNFGWNYSQTSGVTVQSYGRDGIPSGTDVFENDYPPASSQPLINADRYVTTIETSNGVTVSFPAPANCYRCTEDPLANRNMDACISAATPGSWVALPGYEDFWSCSDAEGVWLPAGDVGWACRDTTVGDEATCAGTDYGNGILGRWQYYTSSGNEGCFDLTRAKLACSAADYNADAVIDGDWSQVFNGASFICSDSSYISQGTCEGAGFVWRVISYPQNLCLVVEHSVAGVVAEGSTNSGIYYWDGRPKSVEFSFSSPINMYMGNIAFGIYLHDGASCTGTEFSAAGPSAAAPAQLNWRNYTVLPGRPFGPLEWNMAEYF